MVIHKFDGGVAYCWGCRCPLSHCRRSVTRLVPEAPGMEQVRCLSSSAATSSFSPGMETLTFSRVNGQNRDRSGQNLSYRSRNMVRLIEHLMPNLTPCVQPISCGSFTGWASATYEMYTVIYYRLTMDFYVCLTCYYNYSRQPTIVISSVTRFLLVKKKKNHCRYNRKPDRPRAEGGKPARCDRKLEELYGGTLKKPPYWSWRVVRVKALQHQEDCANGAGKTGAFNVLKSVDTRQRPFK